MSQAAVVQKRRQQGTVIGWQGVTMRVPEDWYPAALGSDRATGYLRVQNAEGSAVEVKWFSPKGSVDKERELEKYRKTMERAARKRRAAFEWRAKPKVPIREARPDKNRMFFGWRADSEALGVIWYCRTCSRVVIAQVTTPLDQGDAALASSILSSLEDHGEDGRELWSLYGLQVRVPKGWVLDKHQLMAGYTMLQFRRGGRLLRAERWALASVALKDATLDDFLWERSRKFWKEYSTASEEAEWQGHPGVEFTGRTRKVWLRVAAPVSRWVKRPLADQLTARAWHCGDENKIFAVHATHPRGDLALLDDAVESVVCH